MEPIDLSLALKATEGDFELLKDVVDAFFEEYPMLVAQVERALEVGDASVVRRASHTLKGSLRLFGETSAKRSAEQLEEIGTSGNLDGAVPALAILKPSLEELQQQLREAIAQL